MIHSEQLDELATALCAAQAEFTAIPKDSDNPFFKSKYASLAQAVKVASPIVAKHGLSISQFPGHSNGDDTLTTWLLHKSGQYIAESSRLHLAKQDAQGQGSATTYAKRYAYMGVLGLVADEDDDGNRASTSKRAPQKDKPPWKVTEEYKAQRSEPLATDEDVTAMATAVKGLTPKQIKLAFSSCNLPAPAKLESLDDAVTAFGRVPQSQAGKLARTLAGVKR